MTQIQIRDDFDRFHDYGCLLPRRMIYFGSEFYEGEYGESGVDFASSSKVIKNLLYLDHKKKAQIILHYSSPGGDWDRGIAVHDCIRGLRSKVTMVGYGCVRSMGTLIMQACDERFLTPNCRFMIHDGYWYFGGTTEDGRRNAKESEWISKRMHEIYYSRMVKNDLSITLSKIAKLCEHDTFMSGDEAVKLGLVDKVLG